VAAPIADYWSILLPSAVLLEVAKLDPNGPIRHSGVAFATVQAISQRNCLTGAVLQFLSVFSSG